MVNKVILVGRLGKDPEVKEFDNGSVANFTLATNERYTKRDGEKVERTDWHNVRVGIPGLVKLVSNYFKKGDPMYLEGKIRTRSYEQDGQTKYITEIDANTISFLPKSNLGNEGSNTMSQGNVSSSASSEDFAVNNDNIEDDLPF